MEEKRDIKTYDYAEEYQFRERAGPKYQERTLRSVNADRRTGIQADSIETRTPMIPRKRVVYRRKKRSSDAPVPGKQKSENGLVSQKKNKKKDRKPKRQQNRVKSANGVKHGSPIKRVSSKVKRPIRGAIKTASGSAQTDSYSGSQDSGMNTSALAAASARNAMRRSRELSEIFKTIMKAVKAVAATTMLPFLALAGMILVVISMFTASSGGTRARSGVRDPSDPRVTIYDRLYQIFPNEDVVVGVMCALSAESSFESNQAERGGSDEYTRRVNTGEMSREEFISDGIGYGLVQWTDRDRKSRFYDFTVDYAASNHKAFDISDVEIQIEFVKWELQNTHTTALRTVSESRSTEDACFYWILYYERPSWKNEEGWEALVASGEAANQKEAAYRIKARRDVRKFGEQIVSACSFTFFSADADIQKVLDYATLYCANTDHGYTLADPQSASMDDKLDLCCAQFVSVCYHNVGFNLPYEPNANKLLTYMHDHSEWADVTSWINSSTQEGFQPGDVIFVRDGSTYPYRTGGPKGMSSRCCNHVILYMGNGMLAEASADKDGRKGDSGDNEVYVHKYNRQNYTARPDLTDYNEKIDGCYVAKTEYLTLKSMLVYRYVGN